MKCLVVTLGALVLPLAVFAVGVQPQEDDLVFEDAGTPVPDDVFQEPKEKKKPLYDSTPINITVVTGHLFYQHIGDDTVRYKANKKVQWLYWNSSTSMLMGVPWKKDVGEYSITFEPYPKYEQIPRRLNIRVVPKMLPNKNNKQFRCKDDDDKLITSIFLKAKFDSLKPQTKANAIYRLHRIYNLNQNTITIEPFKCVDSHQNIQRKKRSTNNGKGGDHKCSTAIHVQIGCNRRVWRDPYVLSFNKSLETDIRDNTVTEILEIPVSYRVTRSVSNLYSRNRRDAGSGFFSNVDDNDTDLIEGSADSEDDYDDEEDNFEDETNETEARTKDNYENREKAQNSHQHRHHHGEGTNISEGAFVARVDDTLDEDVIDNNRNIPSLVESSTTPQPETTLQMSTIAPPILTTVVTTPASSPPTLTSESTWSETSPVTGSPETSSTSSETSPLTSTVQSSAATSPATSTEEPSIEVVASSSTQSAHTTGTEGAHTPITTPITTSTTDAPSTVNFTETDSPELPQLRNSSFVFNSTTEEPLDRINFTTTREATSGSTSSILSTGSSPLTTIQTSSSTIETSPSPVVTSTVTSQVPLITIPPITSTEVTSTTTTTTTTTTTVPTTTKTSTTPSTTTTERTTTEVTTVPVPKEVLNYPPIEQKRLQKIRITAGKPLRYHIPEETFSDHEDGNTRRLKLDLLFSNEDPIRRNHWLQFNKLTQEVYGLPLETDVSEWNYKLVAYDSEGLNASGPLDIHVQQHKLSRTVNHEFSIYLKIVDIHGFRSNVDWELKIIAGLSRLYNDYNEKSITVRKIDISEDSGDVVFTWTNDTVPRGNECPIEEIEELKHHLHEKGRYPHPSRLLKGVMAPDFEVTQVRYQGIAQCEERPKPHVPKISYPSINLPPMPRNQVDHLNVTAGTLLVYKVPDDTFFDSEDGSARNMKMNLLFGNRSSIPPYNWLQFDSKNQEFYGVPMRENVGRQTYHLVVTDKGNATAMDSLDVVVTINPYMNPTVEFSLNIDTPYESFVHSAAQKRNFIERIQELYQDRDTSNIVLDNISSGSTVVTWRNRSLPTRYCPHEQIKKLREVLVQTDKSVTDQVHKVMGREFTVMQVMVTPLGACQGEFTGVHSPDSFVPAIDDSTSVGAAREDYLVTFVLPVVIIAAMISLAGVIACILYKRRRSGKMSVSEQDDERQSFKNKGIPVIFQDELDEKPDPGNKSPIILKEEKPPLPPPEYQKTEDGAHVPMLAKENSEEPYQPPPPFTTNRENNRQSRPKPLNYRRPPPYVPP